MLGDDEARLAVADGGVVGAVKVAGHEYDDTKNAADRTASVIVSQAVRGASLACWGGGRGGEGNVSTVS